MTKNNKSKFYFLVALLFLALFSTACNDTDTNTPTAEPAAQVITGEETLDEIIVETTETIETGAQRLCKSCLLAEQVLFGDACNCNAICDADVECRIPEVEEE